MRTLAGKKRFPPFVPLRDSRLACDSLPLRICAVWRVCCVVSSGLLLSLSPHLLHGSSQRTPKPLSDTRSRVLQSIMGSRRCRAEDGREEKDHSSSSSLQQRAPCTAITQQVASRNRTTSLLEEVPITRPLQASCAHCMLKSMCDRVRVAAGVRPGRPRSVFARTRDDGFLRQQENAHLWQNLHFLRLRQQLAKYAHATHATRGRRCHTCSFRPWGSAATSGRGPCTSTAFPSSRPIVELGNGAKRR
ncbi:uncharacterized protein LOC133472196 isoform X3 [Phyllopteryx taeniolatus]|uniref:uncharacterized protein LOC133472196 isoform X3 n=1 Tax=Phyllopteryx taeniolatus TaxID=161469 RepID=UPI002AD2C95F|nr:uncharacterized protein LOC133472196 isoform X3 [Phyllopteryx taeniolatus]